MNQIATQQERLPMDSVGMSTTGSGAKIAPQNLGEVVKFAEVMCRADIALPQHLRGNAGACMAVALQALEWQMSPFAVASKSYAVGGRIAYEAQLIAAVVNTRSGIKGRLKYRYDGEGTAMTCTVTGVLDGDECEYTTPPIGSITVKNSPLWKSDPQQQLGYFAARSWARRHCPEVILGVYDRDEAEQFRGPDNAKDVTPQQPSIMQRLRAAQDATQEPQDEREGFNPDHVTRETSDALTGEILDNPDTGAQSSPTSAAPVDDAGSAPASEDTGSDAASEEPVSSSIPEDELPKLRLYAKDLLTRAAKPETDAALMRAIENRWAGEIETMSTEGKFAARSISLSMRAIMKGDVGFETAVAFHAEGLGCEPEELGGAA